MRRGVDAAAVAARAIGCIASNIGNAIAVPRPLRNVLLGMCQFFMCDIMRLLLRLRGDHTRFEPRKQGPNAKTCGWRRDGSRRKFARRLTLEPEIRARSFGTAGRPKK